MMLLKNWLRDWLGITKLEHDVETMPTREAEDRMDRRAILRKEIADALDAVLQGPDSESRRTWALYFPNGGRRFEDAVRRVTGEHADTIALQVAERAMARRIDHEMFLDEVVRRLRNKQLPAAGD